MLSLHVDKHLSDWDDYLPYLTTSYNTIIHVSTGYAPRLLVYGKERTLHADVIFTSVQPTGTPRELVSNALENVNDDVRAFMGKP